MSQQHVTRWGIMATGGIAVTFTKDLLIDPKLRDVNDLVHSVTAVASSSSVDSAKKFIADIVEPKQKDTPCKAYGSYEELVKDDNIDIIYIATPHSHHFQNCMLALTNNKPVLCEKAFTVNAEQAKLLYKTAKEKNLFLMEAVWTRYFPLSIFIREQIQSGALGEVVRVFADLSVGGLPDNMDKQGRMLNLDLAGGCLLDLGIYSLTWIFQTLYHTLPPSKRKSPSLINAAMSLYPPTGADELTTMLLTFPVSTPSGEPRQTHAIATTGFNVHSNPDGKHSAGPPIRIQGTKAEIQVFGPAFRPTRINIVPRIDPKAPAAEGLGSDKNEARIIDYGDFPGKGHGMFYEADEAAKCLRAGKLESEGMSWDESILIMEVMDEVRKQGGLKYPEAIETTKYPVDLKAKK